MARGWAAFAVVLYHGGRSIALPQYVGHIPLGGVFNFGHAGVDFFFVLSGFIIFYVHRNDIGKPAAFKRYASRRLIRIYPPYWMATFIALCLAVQHFRSLDVAHVLWSLTLAPLPTDPFLGVAWTLQHEMLFYVVFAILVVSRLAGTWAFCVWMALVVAGQFVHRENWLFQFAASTYHLQFLMGASAAFLVTTYRVPRPLLLAWGSAIAFVVIGAFENAGRFPTAGVVSQLLFGVSAMCAIIGLAAAEMEGRIRIGKLGAFFGNMSYATYLVHELMIGLTAHVLMDLGVIKSLPPALVLAIAAASALCGAALFHQYAERPVTSSLNAAARRYGLTSRAQPTSIH